MITLQEYILFAVSLFLNILKVLVIANIVISWFNPNKENWIIKFISDITDPLLNAARKILPPIGMFDFSPMIVFLVLEIVDYLIIGFFS